MYQTRAEVTTKIPIPRKGTKYVARARSDIHNSVPVVIAVRDLLQLARTAKEVKEMIQNKLLKLNGREIKDLNESIKLFNILEAGDSYQLTFSKNGKFVFAKTQMKERICKVMNKKTLKSNKTQLNLYDGSNILSNDKINVNDTVYLDFAGKIKKHVQFEAGREGFVISGKFVGYAVKIENVDGGKVRVKIKGGESAVLNSKFVVAL